MVILPIIQATEGADRRDNIVGHVALVNSPLNQIPTPYPHNLWRDMLGAALNRGDVYCRIRLAMAMREEIQRPIHCVRIP